MREYGVADLRSLIAAVEHLVNSPPSPDRERGPGGEVQGRERGPGNEIRSSDVGPECEILYLVSATTHLVEGWRDRVPRFELGSRAGSSLAPVVREAARSLGFPVVWETPAEIIPLPPKWELRSRPAPSLGLPGVDVRHFDPYSVVLRLVARGDEPDYLAALAYLAHGWVEVTVLESLLSDLLPRFTSATLAQDPAEFRRKFRGLRQLRASVA